MSAIDRQLLGSDLCNSECTERNSVIHPETSVSQVVISDNTSLSSWFGNNASGTFDDYDSMLAWLQANNSGSSYTLPVATDSTLGGVRVDTTYLTITDGLLGLDMSALNIPTLELASFTSAGTVMLGNGTKLPNTFANSTITDNSVTLYPLRIDNNNRAGIAIPNSTFAQEQADWNTTNTSSASYIKNKPQVFDTINNGLVPSPNSTSGKFLKDDGTWDTPASTTYDAGDNIDITNNVISATDTTYSAATDETLGLIKIGYSKEDNKKPVQLDENNQAFVDTEQHPIIGGMITSGLSAHFFRVGTGSSAGSFVADKWIPIIISSSNNIGKCSVFFEIFGREDGKTSYSKYYLNHMTNKTNSLLCLAFYSEDTNHFSYDDVRCAKYAVNDNNVTLIVYKRIRNVSDSMFIVNILSENSDSYSTQHYFYTGGSSIADTNYRLTNVDYRIGTYDSTNNTITARLTDDAIATEQTMTSIGATNATYYNSQS